MCLLFYRKKLNRLFGQPNVIKNFSEEFTIQLQPWALEGSSLADRDDN